MPRLLPSRGFLTCLAILSPESQAEFNAQRAKAMESKE
jgi:hypothetical protein